MKVAQGTFTGNGTTQEIVISSGSGSFAPDFVIVKTASTDVSVMKISSMATDLTKAMNNVGSALFANGITLTATGFSVGTDVRVNRASSAVYYLAVKGDNQGAVGSYVGNDTTRNIVTGFSPDLAIVGPDSVSYAAQWGCTEFEELNDGTVEGGSFASTHLNGRMPLPWNASSFIVTGDDSVNVTGTTYHYAAFRIVTGLFEEFSYTGNDADGRAIDQLTFQPDFVMVQRISGSSSTACLRFAAQGAGDTTVTVSGAFQGANRIQAIRPLGFEVGTDNGINNNGDIYVGFAFKAGSVTGGGKPGRPPRPPGGGPPGGGGGTFTSPVLKKMRFPEKVI